MAKRLYANNAASTLASGIGSGATSLAVQTGDGAKYPNPTGGNYFMLTLANAGTETLWEIVKVTARSGDTMTIVRAQEGTTALAWSAADKAEIRDTAQELQDHEDFMVSKGQASGVASLDANTKRSITEAQPSTTATYTTASMSPGQTDSSATLAINKISTLYAIGVTRAAWVRLYQTAAARAADLSRDISNDPAAGSGVVGEVYITSATTLYLTPTFGFFNGDGSPSDTLYLAITNKDVNSGTVGVTITFRPEA